MLAVHGGCVLVDDICVQTQNEQLIIIRVKIMLSAVMGICIVNLPPTKENNDNKI